MSSSSSGQIPIDDDYSSITHGGDTFSYISSRTLATTTTMFRHENGRTYHAFRDGEYWGPNDEKQNNHEAIVHHMCLMTLQDKLYLAPIEDPKHILDVGTGTGIWATDMADKFPSAQVIGTDLSPTQPGPQPENCRFEIDDAASEWVAYPRGHFDLVHVRGLFGSIRDWPRLYGQARRHLRPGGWFEQVEFSCRMRDADWVAPRAGPAATATRDTDPGSEGGEGGQRGEGGEGSKDGGEGSGAGEATEGSGEGSGKDNGRIPATNTTTTATSNDLPPTTVLGRWSANAVELSAATGKTFAIAETMAGLIADAGFVDVVERRFKWPVGPWSSDPRLKEIGRWNLLNWEEGMEGWALALYTRVLGWTHEQVQEWLREVRAALRDRKQHVYHEVRVVYARNPE